MKEPGDRISPLKTSLPPNQSTPLKIVTPKNSETGEAKSRRYKIRFFKLNISSTKP